MLCPYLMNLFRFLKDTMLLSNFLLIILSEFYLNNFSHACHLVKNVVKVTANLFSTK